MIKNKLKDPRFAPQPGQTLKKLWSQCLVIKQGTNTPPYYNSSTVVKHPYHQPKQEGSSPVTAAALL